MSSHEETETYRVYLSEESPHPAIESPIEAGLIDYYDSGIWLHLETGRVFLPYEQVQLITQGHPESAGDAEGDVATDEEPEEPPEHEQDEPETTVEEPIEPKDEP